MEKIQIFNFLRDLRDHNSKEWMDANRQYYQQAKEIWLKEIAQMLSVLGKHDPYIVQNFNPKDTISRITNNKRFHPDKPLYKAYFTFSIMDKADTFSPIHISISPSGSFIGCGYHQPNKHTLKNIREAIDYEGEVLHRVLTDAEFNAFYGGLSDYSGKLKTAPQGYDKEHQFVDLLRYKSYTVIKNLTQEEVLSPTFIDTVEKGYVLAGPFRAFLKKANSI